MVVGQASSLELAALGNGRKISSFFLFFIFYFLSEGEIDGGDLRGLRSSRSLHRRPRVGFVVIERGN